MDLTAARAVLRRGSIFHAFHEAAGKGKFGVVLNATPPADEELIYFVIATSQLDFFANGRLDSQILADPGGALRLLPERHDPRLQTRGDAPSTTLAKAAGFSIRGVSSADDLKQCDKRIRGALQLTGGQKKILLPPE